MRGGGVAVLVIAQMAEVQAQQADLELVLAPSGDLVVQGKVGFRINHAGHTVEDSYQVEVMIPKDYPESPPAARETGDAIPGYFHQFLATRNLCLGAPVEVRRVFARDKTLAGFINHLLIPYLFSYSYKRDHGSLPFGELQHGHIGLLRYYVDFFGTTWIVALMLLKYLADDFAPPFSLCPCASGRRLRDCHGPRLDELRPHLSPNDFEEELRAMIAIAEAAGERIPERKILPRRMWRMRKRRRKKALRR